MTENYTAIELDKTSTVSELDSLPCGYLRISYTGRIECANQTLVHWLSVSKEELIGEGISKILPKAGQLFFQSYIFPLLTVEGEVEECYFDMVSTTGDRIPIVANFRSSQENHSAAYEITLVRILKRKSLERDLVQAKRETDTAISALRQSNEALSRFANMVAHDIKAPIRNLKNLSKFITEDYSDKLDEEGKEMLSLLGKAAEKAGSFVDRLLEYGRLESSNGEFKEVDLNEAVAFAVEDLSLSIEENAAKLEIAELPTVLGLESQLVQLFQNLIGNALKYHALDQAPVIRISAERVSSEQWEVSVADNGIGIEEDYREKVFDLLYRLQGSDYDGTGIGLATCKWIVQNHKGHINVESEPGKGSRFYFTLLAKA